MGYRQGQYKSTPYLTFGSLFQAVNLSSLVHSPSNPCHLLPGHVRRPFVQNRTTDKESSVITAKGSVTFTPHRCCPACLNCIRSKVEAKHRGRNPLLIPLLCEFRRMKGRHRVNNKVGVG